MILDRPGLGNARRLTGTIVVQKDEKKIDQDFAILGCISIASSAASSMR